MRAAILERGAYTGEGCAGFSDTDLLLTPEQALVGLFDHAHIFGGSPEMLGVLPKGRH